MDIFSAIVYGIVQGLTEFLPISSSAHLALLPHILKIKDPGLGFDLMMHLGTALAITSYFRKKIFQFCRLLPFLLKGNSPNQPSHLERELNLLRNMFFATFTSFVFIFILKNLAFKYGRSPQFMAYNSLFFGILMVIADKMGKNSQQDIGEMENGIRVKKAFFLGIFQALAIFPGVSRSGVTLTISRFMGMSRHEAAYFSFLLSLPIIFAACLSKSIDYLTLSLFQPNPHQTKDMLIMLLGIGISFVVGMLTIHYFIKLIKNTGLAYFSLYRILLAGIIFLTLV